MLSKTELTVHNIILLLLQERIVLFSELYSDPFAGYYFH